MSTFQFSQGKIFLSPIEVLMWQEVTSIKCYGYETQLDISLNLLLKARENPALLSQREVYVRSAKDITTESIFVTNHVINVSLSVLLSDIKALWYGILQRSACDF